MSNAGLLQTPVHGWFEECPVFREHLTTSGVREAGFEPAQREGDGVDFEEQGASSRTLTPEMEAEGEGSQLPGDSRDP